jgi:hypothetical protein
MIGGLTTACLPNEKIASEEWLWKSLCSEEDAAEIE